MKKTFDPTQVDRLLRDAEAAHRARRLDEAEALYRKILSFEEFLPAAVPEDERGRRLFADLQKLFGQVYNNLGLVLGQRGKVGQAVDSFRSALDYTPARPEILTSAALYSRVQGNVEKARAFAAEAIRNDPMFLPAIVQFGLAAVAAGRAEEALPYFAHAAAKGQNRPHFLMAYGNVLEAAGKLEEAKDKFLAAAAIPAGQIQAWLLAGAVCQRLGRFAEAREHFQKVLAKEPRNLVAISALGSFHIALGQLAEAETYLEQALGIDPGHFDTIANYALVLYLTGRFEEAERVGGELASAPKASEAQRRTGALTQAGALRRRAKPEDALDALQRFAQGSAQAQHDWAFHKEKGLSLEALGRYGEAFQAFSEGNRLFRQSVEGLFPSEKDFTIDLKSALNADYKGLGAPSETPGAPADAPIFIVGFQQGGHQILAALLGLAKTLALAERGGIFLALRLQLTRGSSAYPAVLGTLGDNVLNELRAFYRDSMKELGAGAGQLVLHTNPANLYELPLILTLFPKARIVYVGADPLDVCLHCYFKDLVPGRSTRVYGELNAAAAYLEDSLRLWEKFKAEMRFAFLEVKAEALLDDTETEVNRALDFLKGASAAPLTLRAEHLDGLNAVAFDQKTLSPPGRWKNYREHVTSLIQTLAGERTRLGYPLD
jgi:tetratricopeptide (TPR) repeat protein